MLKSSGAMAFATLASRVLGMVREIVYASILGDSRVAGAFKLAFLVPNLFRRLLGEGALTAAFIPLFKEKERTAGEIEMWRAGNAVISGLLVAASVIVGLGMIGISIALGVHTFSEQTTLMLRLLRVMFPYTLLVCLAAVLMGMLNARGRFFIPALGAAMLNVVMITAALLLAPRMGAEMNQQVFGLAIGVLVAGVAQAMFQMPALWKDGFHFRWQSPWRNETVRLVVRRMIPGTFGVAAFQINVLVTQIIAFGVDPQINASFDYAVRLMELPQGMFGVSLATFLLPALAGLAAEKNYGEFRATLRHGLASLIVVNLIATVLLVILAEPVVRLLFERGEFTSGSTGRAAFALMFLAPGLIAFSTVSILARAFYALGDTQTPMKISVACLVLNLILAFALIYPLRQGGIGLANTATSVCNAGLLFFALRKKLGRLGMSTLYPTFAPLLIGAVVGGLAAWGTLKVIELNFGHETFGIRMAAVFIPAMLAGSIYWGIALIARVPAAKEITGLVLSKFRGKPE